MIKLENVSFSYNQDFGNILKNINIEIKKGRSRSLYWSQRMWKDNADKDYKWTCL